jgi:hypothetical protein
MHLLKDLLEETVYLHGLSGLRECSDPQLRRSIGDERYLFLRLIAGDGTLRDRIGNAVHCAPLVQFVRGPLAT